MFTPLEFPSAKLSLQKKNDKIYVWDIYRKKRLLLTPEEWVRQHILYYLQQYKNYPLSRIASEVAIEVNTLKRRCDAVIYDTMIKPKMIIECKASHIDLTQDVFYQIAQYNSKLQVDWLIMTNGISTIIAKIDSENGSINYQKKIPSYNELLV